MWSLNIILNIFMEDGSMKSYSDLVQRAREMKKAYCCFFFFFGIFAFF